MPSFDRRVAFDPRSRAYAASDVPGGLGQPRSYTWRVPVWLNQGKEGACAGYGWSHALAARPLPHADVTDSSARELYHAAQLIDEFPGEEPQMSGTSVLAVAKVLSGQGAVESYRWAFTMTELLAWISRRGPAVLGMNWHEGMIEADSRGRIAPTGAVVGGHCLVANGVSLSKGTVRLHNSWGRDWSRNGECDIAIDDLYALLREGGEACLPVKAPVRRARTAA